MQKKAVRLLPTAVWELTLVVCYVTDDVIACILTDYQVYGIGHGGVKGFQSRSDGFGQHRISVKRWPIKRGVKPASAGLLPLLFDPQMGRSDQQDLKPARCLQAPALLRRPHIESMEWAV